MTSNDDLDDFFKKKDRKGNKAKKQTALLTNNEELLKQLVIVTSATTAFRENMDALDDDEEHEPINDESIAGTVYTEEAPKPSKPKLLEANKRPTEQHVQLASNTDGQQQDDWEEFEDVTSKYEQLRLKFGRGANGDNAPDDDDYDDDGNPNNNDNNNEATGDSEQQKDRPVWKMNRVQRDDEDLQKQQPEPVEPPKVEEPKPVATGVYRPPQMRTGSSVTVVGSSGTNPTRVAKKKEPNLSSVDEFPSLRATVNKK